MEKRPAAGVDGDDVGRMVRVVRPKGAPSHSPYSLLIVKRAHSGPHWDETVPQAQPDRNRTEELLNKSLLCFLHAQKTSNRKIQLQVSLHFNWIKSS